MGSDTRDLDGVERERDELLIVTDYQMESLWQRERAEAAEARAEEAEQEKRWALDHEASLQRHADRDEDTYTMLQGLAIQAKRRAERLAEALREVARILRANADVPRVSRYVADRALSIADAALAADVGGDLGC